MRGTQSFLLLRLLTMTVTVLNITEQILTGTVQKLYTSKVWTFGYNIMLNIITKTLEAP